MRIIVGFRQKCLSILLIFYTVRDVNTDDGGLSNLKKLRQDLLKNYDKKIRPVAHHTNITTLEMTLNPFYISELNEEKNILVMDAWAHLTWNDDHLTWNPASYQGLKYLPLGPADIWKPDLIIFNSSPISDIDPFGKSTLVVTSNGIVKWTPPATTRTLCFLNYTDYPWDCQKCTISFSSWTYKESQVNITISGNVVNLNNFKDTNPYWKLENITIVRKSYDYDPYIDVFYTVSLIRRPTIAQQLEWIISIGIVILTLSVFWLPPNSDAKLTLGGINILISTALLMYLEAHLKSIAAMPYIGHLMNFSLYTVTSAMIFEVLVMNMASTFGPCAPPQALHDIVSGVVGRILLVNVNESPAENSTAKPSLRKQWLTMATLTDRILFCIFLIVLLSIPKTG